MVITLLEPQVSRGMVRQPGVLEVVDVVLGELDAGKFEEPLPPDAIDPLADSLEATRVVRPHGDDVLYRLDHLGPPRRIVGDERDRQLGERGRATRVRNLSSNPNRDTVVEWVVYGQCRADRVAVRAEHALLLHNLDGGLAVDRGGAHGARGTRSDDRRHLASLAEDIVLGPGRAAVDAENGDVGAVDGAAHVEATGERNAAFGRQLLGHEILVKLVHDRLDDTRGIGCRGVAVHPPLRMDDVGNSVVGAADWKTVGRELRDERLDEVRVVKQELDVVAASEPQVALAVLVGELGVPADGVDGEQAGRARAHAVDLLPALAHVAEDARLERLMVFPLAVVLLDDRVEELFVVRCSDIRNPLRLGCHNSFTP